MSFFAWPGVSFAVQVCSKDMQGDVPFAQCLFSSII